VRRRIRGHIHSNFCHQLTRRHPIHAARVAMRSPSAFHSSTNSGDNSLCPPTFRVRLLCGLSGTIEHATSILAQPQPRYSRSHAFSSFVVTGTVMSDSFRPFVFPVSWGRILSLFYHDFSR
jgi:hypothetical protein